MGLKNIKIGLLKIGKKLFNLMKVNSLYLVLINYNIVRKIYKIFKKPIYYLNSQIW